MQNKLYIEVKVILHWRYLKKLNAFSLSVDCFESMLIILTMLIEQALLMRIQCIFSDMKTYQWKASVRTVFYFNLGLV